MMRSEELFAMAEQWGLAMISIKQLQEYRKRHEKLVECVAETRMPTKYGEFRAYGYLNLLNGEHHVHSSRAISEMGKMYSAACIRSA